MRSIALGIVFGLACTVLGCAADVDEETGSGGGATDGTGGSGGAAGSTSESTGSEAANDCGGSQGLSCPSDAWCSYANTGSCGVAGGGGACLPRPADCSLDCSEVCGCDGVQYCNACLANAAGVDVSADGTCPPDGYSGKTLGNGSELVVFKVDAARGICLRWTLAANDAADPFGAQVTAPWSTTGMAVTNDVGDCALDDTGNLAPPKGDSVGASGISGTVFVPVAWDPCDAEADATVFFQSEASWVPEEEMFDSGHVTLRKCGPK